MPCFIVDRRYAVSGAQEPEYFMPLFDLAQNPAATVADAVAASGAEPAVLGAGGAVLVGRAGPVPADTRAARRAQLPVSATSVVAPVPPELREYPDSR